MKQICRLDKTNKRPYCLRKPCSYKADGTCSGPVVAIQDYTVYIIAPVTLTPAKRPGAADMQSAHIAVLDIAANKL